MRPRAVLLLAAILFLANLWGYDLWAPDEPYFAEGAREMLVDGQWAVPHVNGVVTTDKPPLFFWLIAVFSLAAGGEVTSLTARLPSVLAALGTLALTMRLGRHTSDSRTATLAGFVLCTLYMFWEKARWSQIDSTLCLLIWVALTAFLEFRAGEARGRGAGLLFWAAAALAVLAKGPVGMLLPLGIAVVTLTADRTLSRWRAFAPWSGPALFVAIVAAWAVLATVGGGGEYSVWGAFREHFLERGMHGMHHRQPPWYYLEVLPVYLLPWVGLVPAAYVLAWRRRDATDRFLLVATLFVVAFFSISTEKRELYALPAYPAFALLIARAAGRWLGWEAPPGEGPAPVWFRAGQSVVGGLLVLAGLALPFLRQRVDVLPAWVPVGIGVVLLLGGIATLGATIRGSRPAAVLVPGLCFATAYLFAAVALFPALDPVKSGRAFAERMREASAESRASGGQVLAYDLGNLPESFAFYSDGVYTIETADPARLREHLARPERVFAVIDARGLAELPPELRERVREIERTHLSRRDVLLISNR